MYIDNECLKNYICGACNEKTIDGYKAFYRFTDEQIDYLRYDDFFYDRSKFSASICIRFTTEAERFGFSYKLAKVATKDSLDVFVDGALTYVNKVEKMAAEGTLSFALPKGKKEITAVFPIDCEVYIKNLYADDVIDRPLNDKVKVLWLGDSITQGFGSLLGSQTFVNIVNRKMNYDWLNQGLGGYRHDKRILSADTGFAPDKIIVALGTNDYYFDSLEKDVEEYYERLLAIYNGLPIFAVTPLWRGGVDLNFFVRQIEKIKATISRIGKVKIIDGFTLVPHVSECFYDDLHPNAWGMQIYADNLVEELNR